MLWERENVGANFYTNEKFCALWTCVSFHILMLTIMLCTWEFDTSLCSISSSKLSFFGLFYRLLFEQIVEATWVSRVTNYIDFQEVEELGMESIVEWSLLCLKLCAYFVYKSGSWASYSIIVLILETKIKQFWKLQGERTCTHLQS